MSNNKIILVIDDETQIRKLLAISLQNHDYKVILAATSKEGLSLAAIANPDLVLLDIGLPDENGHIVLTKLREWYAKPIIMLSVHDDEQNIIKALDSGANDYLTKPFRIGELTARIRSALRNSVEEKSVPIKRYGSLEIDFVARTVRKYDILLKVTSTEYALLLLLVKNEGKVLTHHYILKTIWGPSYQEQMQYLRVFIASLRKKIEDNPNEPEYIITESRVGYRFVSEY